MKPSGLIVILISTIVFLAGLNAQPAHAQQQDFDDGLRYYRQKNFQKALNVFNQLTNPEAYLFSGKSLYAMGEYRQAQANLNNIADNVPAPIYLEKVYTSALVDFQLREFSDALNKLYRIYTDNINRPLGRDANSLYRQILNYLTAEQRITAIAKVDSDEIRFDLLESALGKISYEEATQLFDEADAAIDDKQWNKKIDDIKSKLSNAQRYRNEYRRSSGKLRAPEGTIYNLTVSLPAYNPEAQEFSIVRSLYFGVLTGAQDFNRQNRNAKVSVRFVDSGASAEELRETIENLSQNYRTDALIGPLFSEQAATMVPLATEHEIPTIAPLANSAINAENSFLFQTNPTFKMHGREMARYAVNELQMDNFGVLAQSGSSGAFSAEAFREEAERLGAEITYYFIENLQANQFEISQYTRYFGSRSDAIDAVYAPFTGRAALTLIDLLLADLKTMNQPPVVLGSQEWQKLDFSSTKYERLDIHFSQGYYLNNENMRLAEFRNTYRDKFGAEPNQFAMIGYDVISFLLNSLDQVANPDLLTSAIRKHPLYQGFITNIQFDEGNVNRAVKIIEVSQTGEMIIK